MSVPIPHQRLRLSLVVRLLLRLGVSIITLLLLLFVVLAPEKLRCLVLNILVALNFPFGAGKSLVADKVDGNFLFARLVLVTRKSQAKPAVFVLGRGIELGGFVVKG